MIELKYPSKEFASSWHKAIDDEFDFTVEAKIRGFRKKLFIHRMDIRLGRPGPSRLLGFFATLFSLELNTCIACAYIFRKYNIEYLVSKTGFLIVFSKKKLAPVSHLLHFNYLGAPPIQIRYRSKEFASTSRKAIADRVEFCVDARIGQYKRNAVKGYIKWLFEKDAEMLRPNVNIFILGLIWCISDAYMTEAYAVKYSDAKNRLLIHFNRI